jgi:putative ABC transport system substrate-binding protein
MRRRDFIKAISVVATWPLAARAQLSERVPRVGVLMALAENDPEGQARMGAIVGELQKLGWAEGRNIRIDKGWATDVESIKRSAKELVALQPDVILSANTPTTRAFLQQKPTVPIVFAVVSDPIGEGFVASLSRPGGKITGFTNYEPSMGSKWLELLREIAPSVARVTYLFSPAMSPAGGSYYLDSFKAAAASLGVEAIIAPVHDTSELEPIIAAHAREQNNALIMNSDSYLLVHRAEVISLAARYRLPAVYPFRECAKLGGLLSYGNDQVDLFRRAASYVDRILKGAKPSELPVQAPVKFELVINLKTAKALGLKVPQSLLASADEVIE